MLQSLLRELSARLRETEEQAYFLGFVELICIVLTVPAHSLQESKYHESVIEEQMPSFHNARFKHCIFVL